MLFVSNYHILSNSFISAFCNKDKMLTQVGYCFAQIKLAVDFLANLVPKQVSLSQEIFHQYTLFYYLNITLNYVINYLIRLIYEKEMEYGIYFLKKRPRATRAPINKALVEKVLKDIEARKQAAAAAASIAAAANTSASLDQST